MTTLKDKVSKALEEARMLILGLQILLGFKFNSAFHPGFEPLPAPARWLLALSLAALLTALALLLMPTPFHRLVESGEDTDRMHRITSTLLTAALIPFAAALALDFGVAIDKAFGAGAGLAVGAAIGLLSLGLWYGLELILRRKGVKRMPSDSQDEDEKKISLKDKISHVLVEARIVLPGAQAMLGFQLAAYFTEAFEKLPMTARLVHTASALCIGVTILLLMTPAAYHRLVDAGEDTPDFEAFAARLVLGALVPLALGLGSETYVFVVRAFDDTAGALVAGVATALCLLGAWFLAPALLRAGGRPRRTLSASSAGE